MAKFRVRARTVDMLGRQQIAGIPTAISELFKNAHDAYARNVDVDYFRQENLFLLRDDGLGMTKEDFELRWLTLGTESKIGSVAIKPPPKDPDQPSRPTLGEKGIGRLAVAIIGPQVLILSRARRERLPLDKIVAAYIHWGLFELPGINLDDVVVPVREFKADRLPDHGDVQKLVQESLANLDKISDALDRKVVKELRAEIASFKVNPAEWAQALGAPALTGNGSGTHFYIQPADSIINDDIDRRSADNKATRLERNLIGFTNTITPSKSAPPIIARFRDHKDEGSPVELIGERTFFTEQEFTEVDHHFIGRFDDYGQFRGHVGIYQMKPEKYVLNWSESDGSPTECGPFNLSFAYMQGQARDSLVSPEEHTRLKRKLERHGGLYIYRDGIRVQPYGDSDYDWLDIERNRTLGAAYYFYSYRRMFGFIELGHGENGNLSEKAGREGFRENRAYRQMRSILMNFFLQTAGDFFREDGKYSDAHFEKKGELNRNEEIRRQQASGIRKKRSALQTSLSTVFNAIEERKPELQAAQVVGQTKHETDQMIARSIPTQQKAIALMRIEKQGRDLLRGLRNEFTITRPRGVGLPRELSNEWKAYQSESERLTSSVFDPSEAEIEDYVSGVARRAKVPLDDAARLNAVVSEMGNEALKSIRSLRTETTTSALDIATNVKEITRKSFSAVTHAVDEVIAELDRLQRTSSTGIKSFTEIREKLTLQISSIHATEHHKLTRLRDQLAEVSKVWEKDAFDSAELNEALEEELDELRRRRDADLELAQIGLALSTVSHEFDKTVGLLRDGMRRLKAWANANPDLADLYRDLRDSFDHLDEYLTLFTPLDRRVHRTKVEISGKQIYEFLERLFGERFARHKITFAATKGFNTASVTSYPSSIYPAFVNLVDNAIFWLERNRGKRTITLDVEAGDFLVLDNGPGVSARDRENIFALNFSRKPGGRGMGLHISRQSLAKVGLSLRLDQRKNYEGAIFRISEDENTASRKGTK